MSLYVVYIIIAARRECEEPELEGVACVIGTLPDDRAACPRWVCFSSPPPSSWPMPRLLAKAWWPRAGFSGSMNSCWCSGWPPSPRKPRKSSCRHVCPARHGWHGSWQPDLLQAQPVDAACRHDPGRLRRVFGQLQRAHSLDGVQMHEIMLTAAQSLLAVGLLAGLRLDIRGALLLFGLLSASSCPGRAGKRGRCCRAISPAARSISFSASSTSAFSSSCCRASGRNS